MRTTILVGFIVQLCANVAFAQVSATEREALIALYNSTNGGSWTNKLNWLGAEGTECTWKGVTCSGGHVRTLNLINNNLTGSLPPEIGNLSFMTTLYLGDNALSGSLPPELGNLTSLTSMNLEKNQLDGSIPPELGNLTGLWYLVLNRNQLSGSLPPELGDMSTLNSLNLHSNQLTGSIPSEIGNLSNLKYLYLNDNTLSGSIPPELGNLSGLTTCALQWNELSGSIPASLGNLTSVQTLNLSFNQLTGSIPPELGNLSGLSSLQLNLNQLSGSIPPELGNLTSLPALYLDNNQLEGSIPPELANMSSLTTMYLRNNRLSGSIPSELGSMTTLVVLYLDDNRLSGMIPPELGSLSSLTSLGLKSNQLSGDIPSELQNLTSLFNGAGIDIRWNALHSDDAALIAFLDTKQRYGDWQSSQTIAPSNVTTGQTGDHTVWLSWDAVSYSDPGGYEVFSSPTGSGVWTSRGWTDSKTDTSFPVTALDPGTTYDFAVITYTDPHADNLNPVNSDLSVPVVQSTTSSGCLAPVINATGLGPFNLSATGSWDSYLWSTGAITSSVVVDPTHEQWYWVTTTSSGCEESAAVLVNPTAEVFLDGFESGSTSEWSSTTP